MRIYNGGYAADETPPPPPKLEDDPLISGVYEDKYATSSHSSDYEMEMYGEGSNPCMRFLVLLAIVGICFGIAYCPNNMRHLLNQQPRVLNANLARYPITPRYNYQKIIEKWNFFYHDETGIDWSFCEKDLYWNENSMITISPEAESKLLKASFELHNMALEAVDKVVKDDKLM
jgi:hypothetical protein